MERLKLSLLCFLAALLASCGSSAQDATPDTFALTRTDSGHYLMDVSVGGEASAKALLESGMHVMIIDMDFAAANAEAIGIEFHKVTTNDRMNLGGDLYQISHKGRGRVKIGPNTAYEGEVYLLPGLARSHYTGMTMSVPIHKIVNTADGSHVVSLDLTGGKLRMLARAEADSLVSGWDSAEINFNSYMQMPAVRTRFTVGGDAATLDGNFNIDLGNPMVLFLFAQSQGVQSNIEGNDNLLITDARDTRGNVYARAFMARECSLCGRTFSNVPIAITSSVPRFTTDGCIGLRFFQECTAVFDFDRSRMFTH